MFRVIFSWSQTGSTSNIYLSIYLSIYHIDIYLSIYLINTYLSIHHIDTYLLISALSAGAVEYADCTSAEGYPPTNEATCWPWVVTRKALGRIPGGWAVIDPATEWSMACNTPLWPLLGLTGGLIGPDPINRLVMSSPSIYIFYPDRTFKSALAASSQPFSVSC